MRPRSRDDFAIAIICALPLEAEVFGKYYGKQRGDANIYINRWIGKHDVVLCYLPGIGKGSTAGVASSLRVSYTGIELALVVGICGGAPPPPKYQEIFLGDVIISDSVIKYDFGKQYPGGFQRRTGIKDTLGRPGPEIWGLLNGLCVENSRSELQHQTQQYLHVLQQRRAKASYLHKHHSHASPAGCSCLGKISEANLTSIYIGPVASADTVMKSGQHRDEIVRREKVIGFEMEGAGVWDHVPCIIIKGVCDYADSHKSKLWQEYAAATGASAAKAFLECWMPANHKDASRNRYLMIPFARNPYFVGRQEEIQKIEDLISAPDGPKKLAITGLDREPKYSIFWIPCTSNERIQDVEPAEKWILIFDNADDIGMWVKGGPAAPPLKGIIPQSENGHVLFTSRNQQLALNLASPNVLSVPDELLQDNHVTRILLEQLAFLPLAISQAAAYINKNSISLARYMSLLGEHEESTIELLAEEFEDDGCYAEIQNPVATTWLISFLQIQHLDKEASNYLSFMACISPQDIPESILPSTTSAKRRVEVLGVLKAYSFITMQVDDSFLSLHRLVHLATRNWLRKRDTFKTWLERTADQLGKREYLLHALYLVDSAEFQAYQDNHEAFLSRVAGCLQSDGRYTEAETLFRDVLRVRERACGPEHPYTLTSVSQLGDISQALSLIKECADLRNEVLGSDHPHSISTFNTLSNWEAAANQL
ncbi:putative kinesin light chain [Aspergillus tetrazonus]